MRNFWLPKLLGLIIVALLINYPTLCRGAENIVVLSFDVAGKYHDNIFYTADNNTEDFITELSGSAQLSRQTERGMISFAAGLAQTWYADAWRLNGLDQSYAGQASYVVSDHFKTGLTVSFDRDTQPDREIDVTGLVLDTDQRDRLSVDISTDFQATEITSLDFSGGYEKVCYENNTENDYNQINAGMTVSHQLDKYFENTTIRSILHYNKYDYQNLTTDYYAATLGMIYRISELLSIETDLGARYLVSNYDHGVTDKWGAVGSIQAIFQGDRFRSRISFLHDVRAASEQKGTVERTAFIVGLNRHLTAKFQMGLSAGYYLNRADADQLKTTETDQRTIRVQPYLKWDWTKKLSTEATYRFTFLDDVAERETVRTNVVMVKISYSLLK